MFGCDCKDRGKSEISGEIEKFFSVAADFQCVATKNFGAVQYKLLAISDLGDVYAHFLRQKFVAADYQAVATIVATNF